MILYKIAPNTCLWRALFYGPLTTIAIQSQSTVGNGETVACQWRHQIAQRTEWTTHEIKEIERRDWIALFLVTLLRPV